MDESLGKAYTLQHPLRKFPQLPESSFSIVADLVQKGVSSMASAEEIEEATVANLGSAAAGASTLKFYLSTDQVITTADTFIGSAAVGALAGGASSTISASATIPVKDKTGSYDEDSVTHIGLDRRLRAKKPSSARYRGTPPLRTQAR